MTMPAPAAVVLALCLGILGAPPGRAEEPAAVTVYRLSMPNGLPGLGRMATGDDRLVNAFLLQCFLDQADCHVEKLGTAPIREGTFVHDGTVALHLMRQEQDGRYVLETVPQRSGFRISGTVHHLAEGSYSVNYDLYVGTPRKRLPLDLAAAAATDLDIGIPPIDATSLASLVTLTSGVPKCLGGIADAAAGRSEVLILLVQ